MDRKKQLREQYRESRLLGGIYKIINTENGRFLLDWTENLKSTESYLAFSRSVNSCPRPSLLTDWKEYGPEAFRFEVVEELEQKAEQNRDEFFEDLRVLLSMWKEQQDDSVDLYR